jgi:PAS domain S-box-containing protein
MVEQKTMFERRRPKGVRNFRSLRVTSVIAFLAFSLPILVLVYSIEITFTFNSRKEVIADQQQSIAREASNTVKSYIEQKFKVLEATAGLGNLLVTPQEEQKLVLEKLLGVERAFRQLVLIGPEEQELQRVSRLSKILSAQLMEYNNGEVFNQVSQGKTYISSVYIDEVTSEPMVIIAVPITDVFDNFKGILLAEVNLKFMWDLVGGIKIGNKGLAYVVDRQGWLIAFGDISRVLKGENLSHLRDVSKFIENPNLFPVSDAEISKGIQGNYVVSNYVSLGMPDWAVVVELPALEAFAPVIKLISGSIGIVTIGIVLSIIAGVFFSRRITQPVIDLRDAVRKISMGNLDTKIAVASKDEIGELASSFNQMVEDLNKTTVSRDALLREVTERKRAETALRESEERYRDLINNVGEGVCIVNPDECFAFSNPAGERIFGVQSGELKGRSLSEFVDDETFSAIRSQTERQRKGKPGVYDIEIKASNGKKRQLVITCSSMFGEAGNFTGTFGIFRDITERKRAEEERVAALKMAADVMENILDGITITDMNGKITDMNRAAIRQLGYTKRDAIGKTLGRLAIAERDMPRFIEASKKLASSETVESQEYLSKRKDGSTFPASINLSFLTDHRGNPTSIIVVHRDITKHKRVEEKLQQYAAELEQNNQEIKQFAYIVSHDLRAPLVNLKGFSSELRASIASIQEATSLVVTNLDPKNKRILGKALNEDVPEALSFIESSVTRMDSFINAVLRLSRIGRKDLHYEPIDMMQVVQTVLDSLAHQIEKEKVSVIANPLPQITADRTSMEQIMGNLITNAINYLSPERTGKIVIQAEQNDASIIFSIQDNGCGIREKNMDKVFAPFRRAGNHTIAGEGMGLSYVQTLIRRHGGRIWCNSEYGVGSTFFFSIPNKSKKGVSYD